MFLTQAVANQMIKQDLIEERRGVIVIFLRVLPLSLPLTE